MRRADDRPERVRDHEADEADEPGERDGRAGEERGCGEHRRRGAIRIHAKRRRGLFAEGVGVESVREEQRKTESGSDDDRGDSQLFPTDHRHATLQPTQNGT